jgi:4-diphosphocytidyl-2-C-methyl-D-erythritol kinase
MIKSQQSIVVSAPAKINFTFEILGLMPDGYHQVKTLMQAIDLEDTLSFDFFEAAHPGIELCLGEGDARGDFPLDQSNLIAKAYALVQEKFPRRITEKITVTIDKQIPIAAGLAGGSANAAACLVALNQYLGNELSRQELLKLGAQLGADVPFCLTGGLSIGTGRGDELKSIANSCLFNFLIIKSKTLAVSTPWAYQIFDQFQDAITIKPNLEEALAALAKNDQMAALKSFGNVFQPIVFKQFPQLASITEKALELGAWHCQLTGSGPTLFAVVADVETAHFLRRKLQDQFADLDCFICRSSNAGVRQIMTA